MSIYLGNLPYQFTKDDLEEVFVRYVKVNQIQFSTNREIVEGGAFFLGLNGFEEGKNTVTKALDGAG